MTQTRGKINNDVSVGERDTNYICTDLRTHQQLSDVDDRVQVCLKAVYCFFFFCIINILLKWVCTCLKDQSFQKFSKDHSHGMFNLTWLPLKHYCSMTSYPTLSLATNDIFLNDRHYLHQTPSSHSVSLPWPSAYCRAKS